MGATYAAVHVRGKREADVRAAVVEALEEQGLTLTEEEADETRTRRVLLFESDGWVTVADEDMDLDEDALAEWGSRLSESLHAHVVGVQVFHSDVAALTYHHGGGEIGRTAVPGEHPADEDGHVRVSGAFLAPLAPRRAAAEWVVLADTTFPEEPVLRLARLAGVPHPGAGARYLWNDAQLTATRLLFLREEESEEEAEEASGAPQLELHVHAEAEETEGVSIENAGSFTLAAVAGVPLRALEVELGGDALALLQIDSIRGWNPRANDRRWEIRPDADGRRLRARFPDAEVRFVPQPSIDMTAGAAAMRRWSQMLEEQSRGQFMGSITGRAAKAGRGTLTVRVRALDGSVESEAVEIALVVKPAPRRPLLPPIVERPNERREHRDARALEAYGGSTNAFGWIAFDDTFAHVEPWLMRAADEALRMLLASMGAETLAPEILSAGTHPRVRVKYGKKGDLRAASWKPVWDHLRREAQVTFIAPDSHAGIGNVIVAHEPDGKTIFDAGTRATLAARYGADRVVPISLCWSFPQPANAETRERLASWMDGIVREAVDMERCVGALVAPNGEGVRDAQGSVPWEQLAGLQGEMNDWVATHARAPGWRVLVPRPAAGRVPAPGPGAHVERVAAGVLVSSTADSPFAMDGDAREAVERLALPCTGTEEVLIALKKSRRRSSSD